jgi:hypothetical protein
MFNSLSLVASLALTSSSPALSLSLTRGERDLVSLSFAMPRILGRLRVWGMASLDADGASASMADMAPCASVPAPCESFETSEIGEALTEAERALAGISSH